MEHHSKWQTEIRKRSASLESDWWPFVENIKEIYFKLFGTGLMSSKISIAPETDNFLSILNKLNIFLNIFRFSSQNELQLYLPINFYIRRC